MSSPSPPPVRYPDPLPPPPERSDADTQALAEQQRQKFFRGSRANTMLTGGEGTGGGSSAIRFLGGAAKT